jgi:hypothetical protein
MNLSLSGISSLMAPKVTALRTVVNTRRFDPLLARRIWWDKKSGDMDVQDRHVQRLQNQMVGYGRPNIKKRKATMAPPAENLEKRYQLEGSGLGIPGQMGGALGIPGQYGAGLRMAGMHGRGVPINLRNPLDMSY